MLQSNFSSAVLPAGGAAPAPPGCPRRPSASSAPRRPDGLETQDSSPETPPHPRPGRGSRPGGSRSLSGRREDPRRHRGPRAGETEVAAAGHLCRAQVISPRGVARVLLSAFVPWDGKESSDKPKVAADPIGHARSHLVWAALLLIAGPRLLPPSSPPYQAPYGVRSTPPIFCRACILNRWEEPGDSPQCPEPCARPWLCWTLWRRTGRPPPQGAPGLQGESQTENLLGPSKAHPPLALGKG